MLDQPDGVGELSLTRLTVEEDGLAATLEVKLKATEQSMLPIAFSTIQRTNLKERLAAKPEPSWKMVHLYHHPTAAPCPEGAVAEKHFTDATNEGVVNFVALDHIYREPASVRYWQRQRGQVKSC